jgi:hypothetical protein
MKNTLAPALVTSALLLVALTGCEDKKTPAAGSTGSGVVGSVAGAAKDAGKAAGDMAAKGVDAAKDAGKAAGDMAAKGADAVADAAKKVQAEATKWVSDTVSKEWPKAKESLNALGAKIPSIGDVKIREQATKLFDDLKGQVPQMEGLVGKITSGSSEGAAKLFEEAKTMWSSFTTKLGELTKMVGGAK